MSQPFKTCARCGQPAVLQMVQCGRCGAPFPQTPQAPQPPQMSPVGQSSSRPLSAASLRELPRPSPAPMASRAAGRSRVAGTIGVLLLFLFLAMAGAALYQASRHLPGLPSVDSGLTSGPMEPPSAPPSQDPTSMFVEHAGTSQMPTIIVSNQESGTLFMELQDAAGKAYRVQATPGNDVRLQVPAGHYTVTVSSDLPGIKTSYGDASFRQFKDYDARFYFGADDGTPLHLGD